MYDLGIKKSTVYDFPVIAVGNLSVGGTGKSPMVEYIIRLLLNHQKKIATLSRGYKRESKGFQIATESSLVSDIGDEPLQFKRKFAEVTVAVDADRRNGIRSLVSLDPSLDAVLLDDAYQHRKVKAGFYILLTAYANLYCDDILLPTGNLREPRKGANRADIVVVTKCPRNLSIEERRRVRNRLDIKSNQQLFFSYISYSDMITGIAEQKSIYTLKDSFFTLVTGIANPQPLVDYYTSLGLRFDHINFPDHHNFTLKELEHLNSLDTIITTEKDYVRLVDRLTVSLWYQPIEMQLMDGQDVFDETLLAYTNAK